MNKIVNALAVLGSIFIFSNFLSPFPNNILQNIGFFTFAVINVINAKIYMDKGEKKRAGFIIICAIILFCVSIYGIRSLFL